ncbi:hypothetical protein HZI73_04255 [Vallitalea pronyensis]|uniref:Uncharacterized protein n=1 Tax=Vallitalea pronyensis TaxID=1348613 RepID=A0A8J8SFT1_9FIRM|nr:putative ABC exporter domain-containing protein [Vallitalea pronyensis]QUI21553.1 hypothetical protein HZI73_04255 [Vallitalea pronyensis]
MRPLFYIMRRTFINRLKAIVKKPGTLILYLFIAIFFLGFIVISFTMPNENLSTTPMIPFDVISLLFVLILTFIQLQQGVEKGSSFFRQADVNFAFAAPISPKRVLIYGFIKQMMMSFWLMFVLFFQIPNLKNHYPITTTGILIFVFGVFTLYFTLSLLSLIIYSITSRKQSHRTLASRIIYSVYGGIAIWFLIILSRVGNIVEAVTEISSHKAFGMVPIIGWFNKVFGYVVHPINQQFIFNAVVIVLTIVLLIALLYYVNTDYYEDVLSATERRETQLAAKKAGRAVRDINVDKVKKVKQNFGSGGAKAIFYKHLIEYRKNGFFFVGKETIGVVFVGILAKFITNDASMRTVLYFSVYMLLFISMQGKWMEEIRVHYIYLIPADSIEKVFYGTLANHIKNLVDGLILFSVAGLLVKADPIDIVLSAITYMTFGALYIYLNLLGRRLLGAYNKTIKTILRLLLTVLLILPGIVLSILAEIFVFRGTLLSAYGHYFVLMGYNVVISFIMLLSSRKLFEVMEL